MTALLQGLTLYCIAIGMVQLSFLLGLGWSEARRIRRAGRITPGSVWRPDATFAIIPCLDEELVIEATVAALLEQDAGVRILVVDDGSSDRTAERALAAGSERVSVLERRLPDARQGKGRALNFAFHEILRIVEAERLEPDRVLVVVMDADGRLSPESIATVGDLFADASVGGVQLGVRIRNRGDNAFATIQDCEFWGIAALGQLGRMRTRTVSLGGNGQFTRLSALLSLGSDPWSDALTEDLDLAITLSVKGWDLLSTPTCWVSQQGLTSLGPLVRQRTRWFQGHMTTAVERLGDVWRSPYLDNKAVLEVTSYLLIPFLIVLPWSVLSQVGLYMAARNLMQSGFPSGDSGLPGPSFVLPLVVWYALSFAPTILCGLLYARRERGVSLLRALLLAHLLVLWNYVLFAACWRGVFRMVRRRTSWVKTARLAEPAGELAEAEPAANRREVDEVRAS